MNYFKTSHGKNFILQLAIGIVLLVIGGIIGVTDNSPGIVLVLLGTFMTIFAIISNNGKRKDMSLKNKAIFWSPRALCIVVILFFMLFSFDVFDDKRGIWFILIGFLIHNIPSILMGLFLWLSWKREWIASIFFLLLAIVYVIWAWGRFPLETYLLIAGPLVILSVLFFLSWKNKEKFFKPIPNI